MTAMETTIETERHPLEPFLPASGKVLMLGSFPPQQKRWARDFWFYYPNFTNDMWRVLGLVFGGDAQLLVDEAGRTYRQDRIVQLLESRGIGIYDTACEVRRLQDNASDKFLEVVQATDVEALLRQMPLCHTLATTGQKATETLCERFGIVQPKMGGWSEFELNRQTMRLYRMPSTSRAYPLALAKKAEAYCRMFAELGMLDEPELTAQNETM